MWRKTKHMEDNYFAKEQKSNCSVSSFPVSCAVITKTFRMEWNGTEQNRIEQNRMVKRASYFSVAIRRLN